MAKHGEVRPRVVGAEQRCFVRSIPHQTDDDGTAAAQLLHHPGTEEPRAAGDEDPAVRPEPSVRRAAHFILSEDVRREVREGAVGPGVGCGSNGFKRTQPCTTPSSKSRSISCWSLWVSIDLKKPL